MVNFLKHGPKIAKRDVLGQSVVKYILMDETGFNVGEFDNKVDAFVASVKFPSSKIYKFTISELLK